MVKMLFPLSRGMQMFNIATNIWYGIGLYIIGHTCAWFQLNSQFIWDWWRDKPFVAIAIYSIPVGLSFWMGTKYIYEETQELWAGRFIAFGVSYMVFPLLTWWLHSESPLTTKTILCAGLSAMILMIQIYWR